MTPKPLTAPITMFGIYDESTGLWLSHVSYGGTWSTHPLTYKTLRNAQWKLRDLSIEGRTGRAGLRIYALEARVRNLSEPYWGKERT